MPTLEETRERARQAKADARQAKAEALANWAHAHGSNGSSPSRPSKRSSAKNAGSPSELLLARLIVAVESLEEKLSETR